MLKLGQNWGKIANYPPQFSTKIGSPECNHIICDFILTLVIRHSAFSFLLMQNLEFLVCF